MRKTVALILSLIISASVVSSCAKKNENVSTSSDCADSAWLENRLGEIPDGVSVGTADSLGIDMTDFEDDGYIIRTAGGEAVICGKTENGLDLAVRKFAKAYEKGEASELDITYHEGYRIKKLTIGGADISEFTVVRPVSANENTDFAISELVRLIEKATGVILPVSDSDVSSHKITFAFSDDEKYKEDGYTYEVKNGNLNFVGAVERGSMNGVWRFLMNELHWDGLMFGDSVLQSADEVIIPEGCTKTEIPAFTFYSPYRNLYRDYYNDSTVPTFAQKSYGPITNACHGMQNNEFCDEDFNTRQICYTDENRYEECLENVIAYIEREKSWGNEPGKGLKYIDIAQGDNEKFCNCQECRRVFKEEKSNSGAMLRFSNRLADEINETYNGIYFLVFAYAGTNVAPAVTKPNEWLYVTFCFDGNCTNHKIDGTECTGSISLGNREKRTNTTYAEWLKGWTSITDNVYVWYYALSRNFKQYNVFRTLQSDMQYLRDVNVKGIFWQSEYNGFGIFLVSHMVAFELNWNLDMSEEEYERLISTVLEKEYGDGWENIRDYLTMQSHAQELMGCWECWNESQRIFDEYYYEAHFEESLDRVNEAIRMASSALQEKQAVMYSTQVLYQGAYVGYHSAFLANDEEKIAYWCDIYSEISNRLALYGYTMKSLPYTYKGGYESDLITQAWKIWVYGGRFYPDDFYKDFVELECPIDIEN